VFEPAMLLEKGDAVSHQVRVRRSGPRAGRPLRCKLLAVGLDLADIARPFRIMLLYWRRRGAMGHSHSKRRVPAALAGRALRLYPIAVPTRTEQTSWRFRWFPFSRELPIP
jgi:hypothetical protein